MIKVSVIVPVYNVERYLERCLESLVAQTLAETEIIVIDDGSTDGTGKIAQSFREQYPEKIIVKTTENGGARAARNVGLMMASGEYIGFVDADDYADPTMFEQLYDAAVRSGGDIACCGYWRVDGTDVQTRGLGKEVASLYGTDIFQQPDILVHSTPYLWNKIFRRSMLERRRIVFEDLRIYEDLVFTYQSFLYARNIQYVIQPLYHYMVSRDGSLTSGFSEKRFDLFKAYDLLSAMYREQGAKERFREELFFILMKHVFVVFEEHSNKKNRREKLRFIDEGFAYMERVYPDIRQYERYFQVYHNKKWLYESKGYWYLRTYLPWIPKVRRQLGKWKRRALRLVKRQDSVYSRK